MKKLLCTVLVLAMLSGMAAALADVEIPATVGPAPENYGIAGIPGLAASLQSLPSQAVPSSQRGGQGGQNGAVMLVAGGSAGPQESLQLKEEFATLEGADILNAPYDFVVSAEKSAALADLLSQCTVKLVEHDSGMVEWVFIDPDGNEYNSYDFAMHLGGASVVPCSHNSTDCKYHERVIVR